MWLKLKYKCLIASSSLLLAACGQQAFNSNSDDKERAEQSKPIQTEDNDPIFLAALSVITDQCINCHSGAHNGWSKLTSSEAWVKSGLVVKGDGESSEIITRLKNYGSDMPTGSGPLSEDQLQALLTWINQL